jgi:hypothetical protein
LTKPHVPIDSPVSLLRVTLRRFAETLRSRFPRDHAASATRTVVGAKLDDLIPGEIAGDSFSEIIEEVASTKGVQQILEIGSSAGDGSTAAWVRGALRNSVRPRLHCIEVSTERHAALVERWGAQDFVYCHHTSSVPVERFPSPAQVERFYRDVPSRLRDFDLATILSWLQQDLEYLIDHGLSSPGIVHIKDRYAIETFDAVLIDGSEFAGPAELDEVYGARFLLLDDTENFKNWENSRRLQADASYRLISADPETRNGFAAFERVA